MAELARIWSNQQARWWAPNEAGYTKVYEWAGLYPIERARAIVERCNACDTTTAHDNTGRHPDTQVPNEVLVHVLDAALPAALAEKFQGLADMAGEDADREAAKGGPRHLIEAYAAYHDAYEYAARTLEHAAAGAIVVENQHALEPLAGDGTGNRLPEIEGTSEVIDPGLLAAERERIARAIETYAEGVTHPVVCPPDIAYASAIETAARIARTGPPPSITCPRCGRTSYNQGDIANGYCGACHDYTGKEADRG